MCIDKLSNSMCLSGYSNSNNNVNQNINLSFSESESVSQSTHNNDANNNENENDEKQQESSNVIKSVSNVTSCPTSDDETDASKSFDMKM